MAGSFAKLASELAPEPHAPSQFVGTTLPYLRPVRSSAAWAAIQLPGRSGFAD
ncbi:MAG: hypothetical protein WA320_06355 [Candidatus Sulfotelmatobacter sp.]